MSLQSFTNEELRVELEKRERLESEAAERRAEAERREELFEILNTRATYGVPAEVADWIESRLVDEGLFPDFSTEPNSTLLPILWEHALGALEALEDEEARIVNARVGERIINAFLALYVAEDDVDEIPRPEGVVLMKTPEDGVVRLPVVGTRVRLARAVERFPHFLAEAGLVGVVSNVSDGVFCVKLNEHLAGAEEWDNEIVWSVRDGDVPTEDLEVLS